MKRRQVILCSLLLGVGLFILLIFVSVLLFGNIGSAVAWANGETVYIYPKIIKLEKAESKSEKTVTFNLKNLSSKDISLVGEKSSCSCTSLEQIPLKARPGENVKIKVKVIISGKGSLFDQTITFMIAEPNCLSFHPVRITSTASYSSP